MKSILTEPLQEFYSNEENVRREILNIRKMFGDNRTTKPKYDVIFKVLGMMLFYAPEKMLVLVRSTLNEATRRSMFLGKI